jgi:hypothetical protein
VNLEEITTGPLTSISDLIDLEESLLRPEESLDPSGLPARWAFRGQPKTYGTLAPSFQRIFTVKKSVGAAEIIEHDLMETFREHYGRLQGRTSDMPQPYVIGRGFDLRCLSVMQHYGVPTRLLDWTGNFWTAIYFACAGNPTDDAELWYYNRAIFHPQTNENPDLSALVSPNADGTLYQPQPKPETDVFFQRGTSLIAELDFQLTPRMREQFAHHTVCSDVFADHGPLLRALDTSSESFFGRVLIASSCKEKSLRFLEEHKNTTASTVFPDVEGLGRFLHWHLETLVTTIL